MTVYLLKTVFCGALFLAFYLLLLEREKLHRFNRFYLLFSLILSFGIPFIPMQPAPEILPADSNTQYFIQQLQTPVITNEETPVTSVDSPLNPFVICYLAVSFLLFCRFAINLVSIYLKKRNNPSIPYEGAKVVLVNQAVPPHSFLKYIFVNRQQYEIGGIEKEIILHELAHARQKHTLDILLLEFIFIFAWWNPVVFLFIKAVQLNHEYLADEAVVRTIGNKTDYQLLLINKTRQPDPGSAASSITSSQKKE